MKRLHISIIHLVAGCFILFSACNINEIGNGSDVNPEAVYFDYKIWGEEGNDNITVMLQYRFAGRNGTTLLLEEPSKVELDGKVIAADSSKMTGAYYEVIIPVNEFMGKHSIVYTGSDKKKYKEDFVFYPIEIKNTIPKELKRMDIEFELTGLDSVDYVRVLMMDTAFTSKGINFLDTVRNGKLLIKKELLRNLANGPIHLELYKEVERPVKDGTEEGGSFSITYGFKRDFNLKD